MRTRLLNTFLGVVLLAAAAGGGWLVTDRTQRAINVTGGTSGCWRLASTTKQQTCLSDQFLEGAEAAAAGLTGAERDRRIHAFVREQEDAAASDPRLAGHCHQAFHELGRREGRRAAKAGTTPAFPDAASQLCTAGYVHGVAEGYLGTSLHADVAAVFPALCHDIDARDGCAHGMGHALVRAQVDVPSVSRGAAAAGAQCASVPEAFVDSCRNGVYMELAMRTKPEPVRPEDYARACRAAPGVEASLACWGYLSANLTTNDVPLEQVPAACADADLPGQFTCIDQYGRDLGTERVAECEGSSEQFEVRARCVSGALGVHVGSGHVSKEAAHAACAEISDRQLRDRCDAGVERFARGRAEVEAAA